MSVGAVNKQTGDRIPTAGMPAIDDALDLTSVNPVQNAIITAALANKQDKTDNSLQTTDKTVVGAINEHEGDISSLKSGLTNVDVALSVPENSGKNVLPLTLANLKTNNTDGVWSGNTYNRDNVAFTVQTDVDDNVISINVSGTASANTFIILDKGNLQKYKGMILNGCPVGGSENTYNIKLQKASGDYATYATDIGNGYTLPNSITSDNTVLFIRIVSGYNAENLTFAPMIRPATITDPTFAPYIPSVESRIEAVESGLTNLGNKVFSAYGTQNADTWYKIGEYVLPEPNYIVHNFIIAITGTQIKQVTLRCTPTGFDNDLTAVRQVYGEGKNFAIRLASTSKVELYAKVGLNGRHAYSIIAEAGNANYKVTLSDPVASSYTDTDMHIVN